MEKTNKRSFSFSMAVISAFALITLFSFMGKSTDNHSQAKKGNAVKQFSTQRPLSFSANLNNIYYCSNSEVYLNLEVKADEIKGISERTPLNISVVIDKSGSMASKNKLEYVKKAVEYIIDELSPEDYISVITYDDNVSTVYASGRVEDKTLLKKEIKNITAGGFTNLSGGMNLGYEQVTKSFRKGYVNRVLLLSDGLANRGITDREELNRIVLDNSSNYGTTISTFGVGNDFNENLMADLATYGKGNYYYINNSADIPEIFAGELKSVRVLAAQNTKIKVKFPSECLSVKSIFGYQYKIVENEIYIDLKDVFSSQKKNILIKFNVDKRFGQKLCFESMLTYDNARDDLKYVEENILSYITPVKTLSELETGKNVTVMQNVVKFEANDIMEQALLDADKGNYSDARAIIKKGKEYINDQLNTLPPSSEMSGQYKVMEKYEKDLDNAETKGDENKKEMQKSAKYDNYEKRKN